MDPTTCSNWVSLLVGGCVKKRKQKTVAFGFTDWFTQVSPFQGRPDRPLSFSFSFFSKSPTDTQSLPLFAINWGRVHYLLLPVSCLKENAFQEVIIRLTLFELTAWPKPRAWRHLTWLTLCFASAKADREKYAFLAPHNIPPFNILRSMANDPTNKLRIQ